MTPKTAVGMKRLTMSNGSVIETDLKLDCTRCESLQPFERQGENVATCATCGKRHSTNSLVDASVAGVDA